eukprot:Partr_v1_DN26974_c0_g1_i3_m7410 putative Splicing factor 3A subunit 3
MQSILEQQRAFFEETNRLELAISKELSSKTKSHKEKIKQEHRISRYLERALHRNSQLVDLYDDVDGSRKREIDSILAATEFHEFYKRLKDIKDYHRRNPDEPAELLESEFKRVDKSREDAELEVMFTGEENFGKLLDLNEVFQLFANLPDTDDHIDYLTFLDRVGDASFVSNVTRSSGAYRRYLDALVAYLEGFLARAQPLLNIGQIREEARAETALQFKGPVDTSHDDESVFCVACQKNLCQADCL